MACESEKKDKEIETLKALRDELFERLAKQEVDIATYRRRLIDMEGSRDHWKSECEKKDKEIARWKRYYRAADKDNDEFREENSKLFKEIERLKGALRKIAAWDYDIMGDCVADAIRDAQEALK